MSIYLDYNAAAPIKPEIAEFMLSVLKETGNASSVHQYGQKSRSRIEKAREQVAAMFKTDPAYITFTSGATESNATVLNYFAGKSILTGATEHPSVHDVYQDAVKTPVMDNGLIDHDVFENLLKETPDIELISIMLVNNETGVIQDIAALSRIARRIHPNIYIHCDAAQAPGRVDLDYGAYNIDFMSISAHKIGGPQGVGALITTPGAKIDPLLRGGGQEKFRRAGTENVAGITAFGLAAESASEDMDKLAALQNHLEISLKNAVPQIRIFGENAPRVSNTSNICLPGVPSETQLMAMDLSGIAVSNGSACSSGKVDKSYVLKAMGATDIEAGSALRVSTGWGTKAEEIDVFIQKYIKMADRLKEKIHAQN